MESKVLGYGQGYVPASPARFPSQGDTFPNKQNKQTMETMETMKNMKTMKILEKNL